MPGHRPLAGYYQFPGSAGRVPPGGLVVASVCGGQPIEVDPGCNAAVPVVSQVPDLVVFARSGRLVVDQGPGKLAGDVVDVEAQFGRGEYGGNMGTTTMFSLTG
jgi:hypothetical protein